MAQRNGKGGAATATPQDSGANGASDSNRPVHEVRMGRIVGAIWQHLADDGKVWFNVTFSRIYKDSKNNWARSDSFGKNDLPLLVKVADQCHTWMYVESKDDQSN
jgi:hypothetical protein